MKPGDFFNSVAFRISAAIVAVVAATTIAVGWVLLQEERKILEQELQSKGKYLAELMAQNIAAPLKINKPEGVRAMLQGSIRNRRSIIVYAGVFRADRSLIAHAYRNDTSPDVLSLSEEVENISERFVIYEDKNLPLYHIILPIDTAESGPLGFLRLCITKEFLNRTLMDVRQKLYLVGAGITLLGILVGLLAARKVLKPVLDLNKGVKKVGEGMFGVEVPEVGMGEIRELAQSFNKMSMELKTSVEARKSAQKNLIRNEKLYAVGEFSAGIAHEIRNPLTSIKLLVQTIKNTGDTFSRNDIEVIEKEINRINRIIQSFLAFARPEKIEKTNVNIRELLEDVLTITGPKMKQSEIRINRIMPEELPFISGSYDALKQVFLNLVLNALQAMDGSRGLLDIEVRTHNNSLQIIIKDSGEGIPVDNMKKIFDPFFTTKKDGTGMGLALTYNIVTDHGGKIDIQSTPGHGTTVSVELPVMKRSKTADVFSRKL